MGPLPTQGMSRHFSLTLNLNLHLMDLTCWNLGTRPIYLATRYHLSRLKSSSCQIELPTSSNQLLMFPVCRRMHSDFPWCSSHEGSLAYDYYCNHCYWTKVFTRHQADYARVFYAVVSRPRLFRMVSRSWRTVAESVFQTYSQLQ